CALYGVSPITPKWKAPVPGGRSAQPARASASRSAAPRPLGISDLLEAVERFERLLGRHRVRIERRERLDRRVLRGARRFGRRGEEVRLRGAGAQLPLELGKMPTRRAHDILGNARE